MMILKIMIIIRLLKHLDVLKMNLIKILHQDLVLENLIDQVFLKEIIIQIINLYNILLFNYLKMLFHINYLIFLI